LALLALLRGLQVGEVQLLAHYFSAPSTFTRWRTFLSIPASTGVSSCSAVRPILPRPSARSVPRWRSLWPIWLRTCVTLTFATGLLLGRGRRGDCHRLGLGLRLLAVRGRERQDVAHRLAARPRDVLGAAQAAERVDGGLEHVDRVGRPEA